MAEIVPVKSAVDTAAGPDGGRAKAAIAPQILEAYKQMLISLFLATLIISLVTIAITLGYHLLHEDKLVAVLNPLNPDAKAFSPGRGDPPLMIILICAGALGAFFSSLLRLYDFTDLPKALVEPGLGQLPSGYLIM